MSGPIEKTQEQFAGLLPASYGDTSAEYQAVREGAAGLIDLSSRGRIRVSGSEAVMFLNGLITNDMKTLAANHWMAAAFPNVQGRLIAAVRVVRLEDDQTGKKSSPVFLLDTEPATHERLMKTIQRFTLAGDFHVDDITGTTALLSIQGLRAAEIVENVLGSEFKEIPRDGARETEWQQSSAIVVRATHTAEEGFDLIVGSEKAAALRDSLVAAGARPVGYEALETMRIEAGIGRYGQDMDETNVVSEANLDDAVSFSKGCYIGQEIIARIKYRGHVAKKLAGLLFEKTVAVEAGAAIKSMEGKSTDGKEIGRITSATSSPRLGVSIALGYVRYEHLTPGTSVKVVTSTAEVTATVHELPFIRGSWYGNV